MRVKLSLKEYNTWRESLRSKNRLEKVSESQDKLVQEPIAGPSRRDTEFDRIEQNLREIHGDTLQDQPDELQSPPLSKGSTILGTSIPISSSLEDLISALEMGNPELTTYELLWGEGTQEKTQGEESTSVDSNMNVLFSPSPPPAVMMPPEENGNQKEIQVIYEKGVSERRERSLGNEIEIISEKITSSLPQEAPAPTVPRISVPTATMDLTADTVESSQSQSAPEAPSVDSLNAPSIVDSSPAVDAPVSVSSSPSSQENQVELMEELQELSKGNSLRDRRIYSFRLAQFLKMKAQEAKATASSTPGTSVANILFEALAPLLGNLSKKPEQNQDQSNVTLPPFPEVKKRRYPGSVFVEVVDQDGNKRFVAEGQEHQYQPSNSPKRPKRSLFNEDTNFPFPSSQPLYSNIPEMNPMNSLPSSPSGNPMFNVGAQPSQPGPLQMNQRPPIIPPSNLLKDYLNSPPSARTPSHTTNYPFTPPVAYGGQIPQPPQLSPPNYNMAQSQSSQSQGPQSPRQVNNFISGENPNQNFNILPRPLPSATQTTAGNDFVFKAPFPVSPVRPRNLPVPHNSPDKTIPIPSPNPQVQGMPSLQRRRQPPSTLSLDIYPDPGSPRSQPPQQPPSPYQMLNIPRQGNSPGFNSPIQAQQIPNQFQSQVSPQPQPIVSSSSQPQYGRQQGQFTFPGRQDQPPYQQSVSSYPEQQNLHRMTPAQSLPPLSSSPPNFGSTYEYLTTSPQARYVSSPMSHLTPLSPLGVSSVSQAQSLPGSQSLPTYTTLHSPGEGSLPVVPVGTGGVPYRVPPPPYPPQYSASQDYNSGMLGRNRLPGSGEGRRGRPPYETVQSTQVRGNSNELSESEALARYRYQKLLLQRKLQRQHELEQQEQRGVFSYPQQHQQQQQQRQQQPFVPQQSQQYEQPNRPHSAFGYGGSQQQFSNNYGANTLGGQPTANNLFQQQQHQFNALRQQGRSTFDPFQQQQQQQSRAQSQPMGGFSGGIWQQQQVPTRPMVQSLPSNPSAQFQFQLQNPPRLENFGGGGFSPGQQTAPAVAAVIPQRFPLDGRKRGGPTSTITGEMGSNRKEQQQRQPAIISGGETTLFNRPKSSTFHTGNTPNIFNRPKLANEGYFQNRVPSSTLPGVGMGTEGNFLNRIAASVPGQGNEGNFLNRVIPPVQRPTNQGNFSRDTGALNLGNYTNRMASSIPSLTNRGASGTPNFTNRSLSNPSHPPGLGGYNNQSDFANRAVTNTVGSGSGYEALFANRQSNTISGGENGRNLTDTDRMAPGGTGNQGQYSSNRVPGANRDNNAGEGLLLNNRTASSVPGQAYARHNRNRTIPTGNEGQSGARVRSDPILGETGIQGSFPNIGSPSASGFEGNFTNRRGGGGERRDNQGSIRGGAGSTSFAYTIPDSPPSGEQQQKYNPPPKESNQFPNKPLIDQTGNREQLQSTTGGGSTRGGTGNRSPSSEQSNSGLGERQPEPIQATSASRDSTAYRNGKSPSGGSTGDSSHLGSIPQAQTQGETQQDQQPHKQQGGNVGGEGGETNRIKEKTKIHKEKETPPKKHVPHHGRGVPFYSQSEVDAHHRRMLENTPTSADSEFENDQTILSWYLQRAQQELRGRKRANQGHAEQTPQSSQGHGLGSNFWETRVRPPSFQQGHIGTEKFPLAPAHSSGSPTHRRPETEESKPTKFQKQAPPSPSGRISSVSPTSSVVQATPDQTPKHGSGSPTRLQTVPDKNGFHELPQSPPPSPPSSEVSETPPFQVVHGLRTQDGFHTGSVDHWSSHDANNHHKLQYPGSGQIPYVIPGPKQRYHTHRR